ncbi:MAG TPA: DinB family protein [Candidatus Acidoferrum sp.]|jgi:uncharacterized damage-inducible protein DinB
MTMGQSMLPEFDEEMKNTRKALERVPDDKFGWKPHEKSGTLGWLAGHVGTVPEWITMTLKTEVFDYAPVSGPTYEPPKITNRAELLAAFDKAAAEARTALSNASDEDFSTTWTLLGGGQKIFAMPRAACIRGMCLNHLYHHRGQLTVYLRLLGVPVPGLYGPSADEQDPGQAASA